MRSSTHPAIEQWPTTKPIPYARNARVIPDVAVGKVAASIKEFGFKAPIIVDGEGVIIAGHTRLLAAQRLGLEHVPVIVAADLTPAQVKAYRLADNRTAQETSWDMDLLQIELEDLAGLDIDVSLTGFEPEELTNIGAESAPVVEDEAPEPPEDPITKPGDLWMLGEHRVLCGDATDAASYVLLLRGSVAALTLTDPPYGLGDTASGKNEYATFDDTKDAVAAMAHEWLPLVRKNSDVTVFSCGVNRQWLYPEPDWVMCWFYGGGQLCSQWGFNCWQPFLCYGKEPSLARGKGCRPDAVDMNVPANAGDIDHPCPKPVKLWVWMLDRLAFDAGAVVLDPFLGSGTTLIAAEQTNRICYGMEIDPRYCDVIVNRWQNLTGKTATLAT